MKRMKKILAAVLVVVMSAVLFAGCGSSTSKADDPILGEWKCSALDMGSGDIMSQLGSSFGDSVILYVWDDGTCRLDMMGSSFPMKWKNMGDDYKMSIDLKSFAEANGMTEEEMKKELAGSSSAEVKDTQNYKATLKDGKIVMDMGRYYDDNSSSDSTSADSEKSPLMEFTFERTGDAPDKDSVAKSSSAVNSSSVTTNETADSSAKSDTSADVSSSAN